MLGERVGPYRIEEELGSGGMGTVYRAVAERAGPHLGEGERVALKLVHPHLLAKPGFFERFLREAEIGRRIDHRNVVRTHEAAGAEVGGRPVHYLVMEYVEGQTLRDLLREMTRVPETLVREIAAQVASGLAAIHAAGIVHRDLKPENVLLTPSHDVRLMDLGVARLVDESIALTREGQFAGSVLYAAPEQFGRGAIGPSADLYALGVLLYELTAGLNPFRRDAPAAVVGAHLELMPEALVDRDVDASLFLSEVVRMLLAKQPEDRFEDAGTLYAVLTDGERSSWWAERESRLLADRARRPRLRIARSTALFGRDAELDVLQEDLESALKGRGRSVLLLGETGIGKTRLLDAFLRDVQAEHPEVVVLYGSYPPFGGTGGLSDGILDHFGGADLETALEPYLESTPDLVAPFAAVLRRTAAPEASGPAHGEALNSVTVHLMRGMAARRPLVWIVDDLQFAEPESRSAVLSMARAVDGHRILLLVTSRPELPEDDISHLTRLETCRRVDLDRLSPRQVVMLLRDALGSEILADRLGARIAYKSDGIPFFIFEILRGLEESGLLQKHHDGSYVETTEIDDIEVPSAVRDLVEARIKGLGPDVRAILDVGAVEGYEFDPGLICDVLERPRLPVLQELAELSRRSGIVRPSGSRYQFDHHQIQEVLVGSLPLSLKEEYHALLAEAYERGHPEAADEGAVFLARHHLFGSRPAGGLPYLESALRHLERGHRNGSFLSLAGRALVSEGLVEGRRRVELLLRQARLLGQVGRRTDEGEALDEALGLASELGASKLRARALERLGGHLRQVGRAGDAEDRYEEARALALEVGDPVLEAEAIGGLGNVFASRGEFEAARSLLETRVRMGESRGGDRELVHAYGNLAAVLFSLGDQTRALELMEQALEQAVDRGDVWLEVHVRGNLGMVLEALGRIPDAGAQLERAQSLARQIGDREGEAYAEGTLGTLAEIEGRLEDALAHFTRSLALHREVGNPSGEAIARGNLGNTALGRGDLEAALGHYERSLALSREIRDLHIECNCLSAQGHVLGWLGDPVEARGRLRESLDVARRSRVPINEAYTLYAIGTVEDVAGDSEKALRATDEALSMMREHDRPELVADALLQRGRILASGVGGEKEALRCFEEAERIAREVGLPRSLVEAVCRRARLRPREGDAAERVVRENTAHLKVLDRMNARHLLWRITGEPEHLREARTLLDRLVNGAPASHRTTMIRDVPLHRAIHAAAAEDLAARDERPDLD